MHVVFVDESGDLGREGSPTAYFLLCAVVVRHDWWEAAADELSSIRRRLWERHGLREEGEIHAAQFLGGDTRHKGLDVRSRFQCIHHAVGSLRASRCLRFTRFAVRKGKAVAAEILGEAWRGLAGEMHGILAGEEASCGSRGMIVVMDHHGDQPYRARGLGEDLEAIGQPLLELPFGRRSQDSRFLQCADLLGYLTKQGLEPNRYFAGSNGRRLLREAEKLFDKPCQVKEL